MPRKIVAEEIDAIFFTITFKEIRQKARKFEIFAYEIHIYKLIYLRYIILPQYKNLPSPPSCPHLTLIQLLNSKLLLPRR